MVAYTLRCATLSARKARNSILAWSVLGEIMLIEAIGLSFHCCCTAAIIGAKSVSGAGRSSGFGCSSPRPSVCSPRCCPRSPRAALSPSRGTSSAFWGCSIILACLSRKNCCRFSYAWLIPQGMNINMSSSRPLKVIIR